MFWYTAKFLYYDAFKPYGFVGITVDPHDSWQRGRVEFWYYVFYISKFYEFLDTVFLLLKKRPLRFLHVYHHFVTAFLCWVSLSHHMPVKWYSSTANCFVHVIMYFYYFLASCRISLPTWCAMLLTSIQIIQFITGVVVTGSWAYYHWVLGFPTSGTAFAFYAGEFVLWSYLILFIQLFHDIYGPTGKAIRWVNKQFRASGQSYDKVTNLSSSWVDGKALLLLLWVVDDHSFDFEKVNDSSVKNRIRVSNSILKKLRIPQVDPTALRNGKESSTLIKIIKGLKKVK